MLTILAISKNDTLDLQLLRGQNANGGENKIVTFHGVPPIGTPEFAKWLEEQHATLNPQ